MITVDTEQMSDIFTKYHLRNLPFNAVIHKFTEPDKGDPHNHPFSFTTHILKGSYIERIWTPEYNGKWVFADFHRTEGTVQHVRAHRVHQIISLPDGDCYTLILPGKWERKSGFWRFDESGAKFREWDQPEFN